MLGENQKPPTPPPTRTTKEKEMREFWIVLIDDTPEISGRSNRHFRVEFVPPKPEQFGEKCLSITHVREVENSPYTWSRYKGAESSGAK